MITSNNHEHSLSIGNVDIVAIKDIKSPELVIGFADDHECKIPQIVFTPMQARALRQFLNSEEVQQILDVDASPTTLSPMRVTTVSVN